MGRTARWPATTCLYNDQVATSFFAILDDIAALAKAAAASIDDIAVGAARTSVKATGVVIDDAAVTPQYVQGISPKRELPVIWKIAKGSLLNKVIVIAAIMILSLVAPWVFPWILIVGGSYLCYEGAEKVWHSLRNRGGNKHAQVPDRSPTDEKKLVGNAVRTDLVLSTEIMLISMAAIDDPSWARRLGILVMVALIMTMAVYGVVGLLVKMDDAGVFLVKRKSAVPRGLGRALVKAMPWVFRVLSLVGVVAMLWVGGHILVVNLAAVGWHVPLSLIHRLTPAIGGIVAWLVDTALSAVAGMALGAVLVAVLTAILAVVKKIKT